MSIKDDLSKYPCFLFSFGTIRPIPKPQDWSSALQCHHFVPKSYKKTNPKFYERVEYLQKLIYMASQTHYDLHAMGEETFNNKYGIEKHKLLFNRKKWRAGYYESTNGERASDI